jgi:hypothetical protein
MASSHIQVQRIRQLVYRSFIEVVLNLFVLVVFKTASVTININNFFIG